MERSVAELLEQNISREGMSKNEHKAFVDYWFDQYERVGFANVFNTSYEDQEIYEGQTFEVLGRCGEDTHDLEVLPAWKIRLACGVELDAYPEEICLLERLAELGFAKEEVARIFSHDGSTPAKSVMKAFDIDWDVDEEEDREFLPNEIEIPVGMVEEDEISDYVSDVTGFCHKGFRLTISVPGPTCYMLTDDGSSACGVNGSDVAAPNAHYDESSSKMAKGISGLEVPGHVGTWHVIDHEEVEGHTFWLLEHDTYGESAAHIIVDDQGELVLSNIYGRFDGHIMGLLYQEIMPVDHMPDPSISVAEMKKYGYAWGGMLPMCAETALKFWDKDVFPVYRLYEDDSEGMVMDANEIQCHAADGGIFGVEKVDWMAYLEHHVSLQMIKPALADQVSDAASRAAASSSKLNLKHNSPART